MSESTMSVQLEMSKNALIALASFSAKQGNKKEGNSGMALHFRYRDELSLRIGTTNGSDIALAQLTKGSPLLPSFFWPDDEEQSVSILAVKALKMLPDIPTPTVLLRFGYTHCEIIPVRDGEPDPEGVPLSVLRIRARQVALFDDLWDLPRATAADLTERAQLVLQYPALKRARDAAMKFGAGNPDALQIAQLGPMYGLTWGGLSDFYLLTPCSTYAGADAGLPPEWTVTDRPPVQVLNTETGTIDQATASRVLHDVYARMQELRADGKEEQAEPAPDCCARCIYATMIDTELTCIFGGETASEVVTPEHCCDDYSPKQDEDAADAQPALELEDVPEVDVPDVSDEPPCIDLSDKTDEELAECYCSPLPAVRSAAAALLQERIPGWQPVEVHHGDA